MSKATKINKEVPKDIIVLISGVPGAGKTTVSYQLLHAFDQFRIIEETDLIREVLRGYIQHIQNIFGEETSASLDKIKIFDNRKFLSFNDAKHQCQVMKASLENIIQRQQRKRISTIINGVHIVPEVLNGVSNNVGLCYINLYFSNETELIRRLKLRDPKKYTDKNISLAFKTNCDLYMSTEKMVKTSRHLFHNVDVSFSTIEETLETVIDCLKKIL